MTRISTLFVASTTLAALALSVSIADAAQTGGQTPQAHNSAVTGTPAKPPTNQPSGPKTFGWSVKPKAVNSSGTAK
jgi:hypothetical protein